MFVFKGNFCPRFTQYCLIWVVLLVLWLAPNMMVMTYGQQSGNTQAKSKFTNSDAPTLVPENPFDRSSTPATLNPNKISTTDACSQTPIVGQNKVYSAIGLKITCQESKTGNLVWTQTLKSDFVNSGLLLVSEIDKIFANCNNDSLYCFDSENGQILWKIPTGGNCSQMTYKQGGLYFTCCGDASLYAIDAKSGQQKWNVTQPAQAPLNQVITSLPTESKQNNTIQPTTTIAANTNKTTATTTPTAAVTPPKAVSQPAVSKPAKKLLLGGEFDWDAMTLTASADIDHLNEDLIYANYIEQHSLAQAPLFEGYSRQNTHGLQLYPTNIYAQRLAVLPTVIPMEYNEYVKYFIDLYVGSKRDQVSRMLGRASHYFPMVEEVLARHGLPIELKCIPVIESAMSPNARSENGRMGMWMLPYRLAQRYGLETNSYVDERCDPILASEVAAKHLKYLYERYQNWYLAIAAFNSGEGAVDKALRETSSRNFWEVIRFLPPDNQGYLPLFIAANYIINYHLEHDIAHNNPPYLFYLTDTVQVRNLPISLAEAAKNIDMDYDELRFLNPALLDGLIPFATKPYALNLPINKVGLFMTYYNSLRNKTTSMAVNSNSYDMRLNPYSVWNYNMNNYSVLNAQPMNYKDSGKTVRDNRPKRATTSSGNR